MKLSILMKVAIPLIVIAVVFTSCDLYESPVQPFDEAVKHIWGFDPIPGTENITAKVTRDRRTSYFKFEVNGADNDVFLRSGNYSAWCALYDTPINSNGGVYDGVKMYSTQGYKSWNKLNYLLNNKYEYMNDSFGATWREVQVAIWALIDFPRFDINNINVNSLPGSMRDGDEILFDLAITKEILTDVNSKGKHYQYQIGDTYAIFTETPQGVQNGILEGCSPGFWRQKHHFNVWPNGYDPDDLFSDYFKEITVGAGPNRITNPTLIETLKATGGGVSALARHAVAALLNAAHAESNANGFPYTVQEVIDMTLCALDSDECDIEETKDKFDLANNFGCSF